MRFRFQAMFEFKLLDRYVLKNFFLLFILCLISFLVIFNIVDLIEKLDKFLKAKMNTSMILSFYLYQLPFYVNIAIPMALLLAAVFTIGTLSKNNELAALKSSGISLYRISIPLLTVGFLFSIGSFFFEDTIVIPASRVRLEIEQNHLKRNKKVAQTTFTNIMHQDSPICNIVISSFNTINNTATSITIQDIEDHTLKRRIDVRKMVWIPELNQWKLSDFKIRTFDPDGNEIVTTFYTDSLMTFNLMPDDIVRTNLNPETMRHRELVYFIQRLRESGNDPRKWEVNLHYKFAFPFTNLIVILFGLPLAAMKHQKEMSFGASMSLLVIFTYYGFVKFGQVLGYKAILNPLLSVWLGNIVFLTIGGYLLYKIRQ